MCREIAKYFRQFWFFTWHFIRSLIICLPWLACLVIGPKVPRRNLEESKEGRCHGGKHSEKLSGPCAWIFVMSLFWSFFPKVQAIKGSTISGRNWHGASPSQLRRRRLTGTARQSPEILSRSEPGSAWCKFALPAWKVPCGVERPLRIDRLAFRTLKCHF